MTTETDLIIDALRRDLVRYAVSFDLEERKRIKDRLIDDMGELGHQADYDDVIEKVVRITGPVVS